MFLIDSHTHLYFPDFSSDFDGVVNRALEAGVRYFVNIGTDVETSRKAIQLAERFEFMYATVGFHPHDAEAASPEAMKEMERLADHPKVVAIGEVGLDFYKDVSPRSAQQQTLIQFFELAKKKNLPLALHIREAHELTIELLKAQFEPPVRAVSHCFSGTPEIMKQLLDLGLYISFAGQITYKKTDELRQAAKLCPADRILIETDAPFLAPQAFRGKRNEPAFMVETARFIAQLRGESFEDFSKKTSENSARFYGLKI